MDSDYDDLDEDIERLKIVLQDEDGGEGGESDGELRVLDDGDDHVDPDQSRPSTSSDITGSSLPTTSICTEGEDALVRFDPSSITAETCLAMNRAYQEVLLDTLRQVEISLAENRTKQHEKQSDLDEFSADKPAKAKHLSMVKFTCPFFKDTSGGPAPSNEDVKLKETLQENKQTVKPKPPWNKAQRKCLMNAVKMDALEQLIKPLLSKLEVATCKANGCKNTEEIEASKARIDQLTTDIEIKKQLPSDELLRSMDESKIDFMKIAVVNFHGKFDAIDCECMWKNVVRPGINKDKWTDEEIEQLESLVEKYKMRNWKQIAEELGTHRTPFQCLQFYQKTHFEYDQSEWTEAEDELLREVVETCRYGTGRILWPQVAYYIDRRSGKQCETRWSSIDEQQKKGKWDELEDMLLLAAVQTLGASCDWTVVKEFVPGRSAGQCKDRYLNCLNSNLNFDEFTYQEDTIILKAHKEVGNNWAGIATKLRNRTDAMVMSRHRKLMKWKEMSDLFFKQPKEAQKKMLHPAFQLGSEGGFVLRDIKGLTFPRRKGRPKGSTKKSKKLSEIQELKLNAKTLLGDAIQDDDKLMIIKQEPQDIDEEHTRNTDEEHTRNTDNTSEDRLYEEDFIGDYEDEGDDKDLPQEVMIIQREMESFLKKAGIVADDYDKQIKDMTKKDGPVPRPPPVNKSSLRFFTSTMDRLQELENVVQAQVEYYLKLTNNDDDRKNEARKALKGLATLAKQKESDHRGAIVTALGNCRPGDLTVRELLSISRKVGKRVRRKVNQGDKKPRKLKSGDGEYADLDNEDEESIDDDDDDLDSDGDAPWKESASDQDSNHNQSSDNTSDEEFWSKLDAQAAEEEKLRLKRPRKNRTEQTNENVKKIREAHKRIRSEMVKVIEHKLQSSTAGRKRRIVMYNERLREKSREKSWPDGGRMNRKSLVLLLKTLDVNAKSAYMKAHDTKRNISALAMLRSTNRIKKTRSQSAKIPKQLSHMNEVNETSELVLQLSQDLKISEDDLHDHEQTEKGKGARSFVPQPGTSRTAKDRNTSNYEKALPYIPPNLTNLKGMKMLLLDHKCLIDQAGAYFDPVALKSQLYQIKRKGPNPLMNVLNAVGKSDEALEKRRQKFSEQHVEFKHLKKHEIREVANQKMNTIRNSFAYKQLMTRFQSVFSWPALMSTIPLPKGHLLPKSLLKDIQSDQEPKHIPPKTAFQTPSKPNVVNKRQARPFSSNSSVWTLRGERGTANLEVCSVNSPNGTTSDMPIFKSDDSINNDITAGNDDITLGHTAVQPPSKPAVVGNRHGRPVSKNFSVWTLKGPNLQVCSVKSPSGTTSDMPIFKADDSINNDITRGNDDITMAHNDITTGNGDTTLGQSNITIEKSDITMGHNDITTGIDDITMCQNDITTGNDDITAENNDVNEDSDEEDLPEEEAIEKLVQKIMKEYEMTKKPRCRYFPKGLKQKKASMATLKGREERKRTLILKRLGLYEKMQEYKKKKQLESSGQTKSKADESVASTSLVQMTESEQGETTDQIETDKTAEQTEAVVPTTEKAIKNQPKKGEGDVNTAVVKVTETSLPLEGEADEGIALEAEPTGMKVPLEAAIEAVNSPDISSVQESSPNKGATPDETVQETPPYKGATPAETIQESPPNKDTTPSAETAVESTDSTPAPKRKRGRQSGIKLTCYNTNQSPSRKSGRNSEKDITYTPVTGPLAEPQTKAPRRSYEFKNTRLRTLIPEKMGKLVSKITEVPILNEPIPEEKPKIKKPRKKAAPKRKLPDVIDIDISPTKAKRAGSVALVETDDVGKSVTGMSVKSKADFGKLVNMAVNVKKEPRKKNRSGRKFKDAKPYHKEQILEINKLVKIEKRMTDSKEVVETRIRNAGDLNKSCVLSSEIPGFHEKIGKKMKHSKPGTTDSCTLRATKLGKSSSASTHKRPITATVSSVENAKNVLNCSDKVTKTPVNEAAGSSNGETSLATSGTMVPPVIQQMPGLLGAMMFNPMAGQGQTVGQQGHGYGPIIVPVPVTVGDSQQMAYMPVFANSEGKYILNGKELHIGTINTSSNDGAISLPFVKGPKENNK